MATSSGSNICIPMHLDAFALSPDCCRGPSSIAPYTQPNYTGLRLDTHLVQHDVLDHVDFHNTQSPDTNPRIADLGLPPPNNRKHHRMGVHLHWSLPRFYRKARSSARQSASANSNSDPSNPTFPLIPNRFLVTRHIRNYDNSKPHPLKEYQSWVIESDAIRSVTSSDQKNGVQPSEDLESDVSPFVAYGGSPGQEGILASQAEVFLGRKWNLEEWKEDSSRNHTPLTLMNSSNPMFPDYALHNVNVLSMIDNFSFNDPSGATRYLNQTNCNYYVVGWHQSPKDDPFGTDSTADLISTMKNMMLELQNKDSQAAHDFGGKAMKTRCLVYGAIYDVTWDVFKKPRSLADEGAVKFDLNNIPMEPLSIGTTPLDAILTFLDAHQKDATAFFGPDGTNLAKDITEIAQFLYAIADGYDARVQAQDLLAQQNFAKSDGGSRWTFAKGPGPGGASATPTQGEVQSLREINELQIRLDVSTRKLKSLKWEVFAEWWKHISDPERDAQNDFTARDAVSKITQSIWGKDMKTGLRQFIQDLKTQIKNLQDAKKSDGTPVIECKASVRDPFHQRSDPTMCIAGLDSGRPNDFLDTLKVCFDEDITTTPADILGGLNPVPDDQGLKITAAKLLAKCLKGSSTTNGPGDSLVTTGFRQWGNQNPFVPLFIEWEGI
jgi:hypothetical protein